MTQPLLNDPSRSRALMDRANGAGQSAAALRAERFEDEKRRIIESCFSKKEPEGSLVETYITHVRITEYSSHPSTPPPPQARSPESEKPRIIVVSVRRSGRVRVHKSKENVTGSFSIGKTWNLDDLSHIESFTGPHVAPNFRDWAGDTGFVVALGKPYFWQAQTDKEKKFFVASLIKIYGKYTGGKAPELAGFDQRELDQVLGAGRRQPAANLRSPTNEQASSHQSMSSALSAATSPSMVHQPSTSSTPEPPRSQKPAPLGAWSSRNGANSPVAGSDSTTSRERAAAIRWTAQNNKSQDSVAESLAARSDEASLSSRSRNDPTGPGAKGRFIDSREPLNPSQDGSTPSSSTYVDEKLPPERRRPPMDPSRPQDRDLVPQPLLSPAFRKDAAPPPPRNTDRMSPRQGEGSGQYAALAAASRHESSVMAPLDTSLRGESRGAAHSSNTSLPTTPSTETMPNTEKADAVEEDSRPGLGPMIKAKRSKGDIAGALWKAASAATAFRPRPGGAGDRLLAAAQSKPSDGPDGITDVVPALVRPVSRQQKSATPEVTKQDDQDSHVPKVKVTEDTRPSSAEKREEADKEEPQRSAVTGNDAQYFQSLGIASDVLDERSEEFGKWLDYFGWVPGQQMRSQSMNDFKIGIKRELNKAQAGGWLARFQEEDDRVEAIKRGIDLACAECEEMDNLLTLYAVELSTLSEDIAYIETQGQGLQVQTANQKLLRRELESLLETCAITSHDLEALRVAPLDSTRGLEDVEHTLVTLFKAMMKIDPTLGGHVIESGPDSSTNSNQAFGLNSDYGKMRIVQEKKEMYLKESSDFMRRLFEFMRGQFAKAFAETRRSLEGALSKRGDLANYDTGKDRLWKYSAMMLYARDVDLNAWNDLIVMYQDMSHPLYKGQVQTIVAALRRNARKPTAEEAEILFSSQVEKQQEGVASTARKLTVKRSQTLARALRSPLTDGSNRAASHEKALPDDGCHAYEVFSGVLEEVLPLVKIEQNFIIDFFHASTLETADFPDAVAACTPRDRRGGDLKRHRLMEPDRELARRVNRSMELIFAFLQSELQRLMEWVIGQDPLQGVGVLAALEKKLVDTKQSNQEFVHMLLQKLHDMLEGRFKRFVDEQVRAIEETKVKINKRKGVISFIRIFPGFLAAVENMLMGVDANLALRRTVDREYERILKSMFNSLKVIAREHPAVGVTSGAADPEDKEALNFHILLMENMNLFIEETDTRSLELVEEWKEQAKTEYHEHMYLYIHAVMRRPLGKLLDYLENIEAQLQSGKSPEMIARQPSNSKGIFNKVLSYYDAKEVRKGIEALRKRVEKHFGDAEDPGVSRGLVPKVTRECEQYYNEVGSRIRQVATDVYGGEVAFEWPREEIKAAFR